MPTQCNAEQLQFSCVERRRVVAAFDGGTVSSDAGALLLGKCDEAIGLIDRLAGCFVDSRDPNLIEHTVRTLIGQRVFAMALGYEDLNDHDSLRHDPVFGALLGKLEPKRRGDCAALAGKSTLNRLELHAAQGISRYHKIRPDTQAIEGLWVDLYLDAHHEAPSEIVLDLDATDDPLHGHQEGRFFHGYYDGYCYLPLYIFAGEHLLCAKLRRSNIDGAAGAREEVERIVAQIRQRWGAVKIILRADSGFCREELMSWCEQNAVDYVFGLARNARLVRSIGAELQAAAAESRETQQSARRFKELVYRTRKSWCRARRVVAKAEQTGDKANPRFIVTSVSMRQWPTRALYEEFYCARGECENRIKEAQLDLFADRLSTATFRANQLRLWLSSAAYVLMHALRRIGLAGTALARACANTIRLRLLKIGAVVTVSVRRVKLAMSEACATQREFIAAFHALSAAAR
ncbi:transposase [Steroidobacter denitrificans]|uniref:Transposase n=1 Tax=Steroidobacter denitrificans TaxID=465721 RepID=A0A127FD54_STEDE|nr:IS1380 family transposase [Steroidobacter denitrificans]AMN47529.1 transposase [Steroidobacter denitrificans]AMN48036.1 transposase [Steroidobacter denitrificans]